MKIQSPMTPVITPVHRTLLAALFCFGALIAQSAFAQTEPTLAQRPAEKSPAKPTATSSSAPCATVLPTEDTVNSFLFQTFGYDSTITWKIEDIRPSEICGLAEVSVVITTPQGANANRLLVSSDGKHAVTGEVLPFGAKPYRGCPREARETCQWPRQGSGQRARHARRV